jgi:hypothetical protein
MAGTALEQFAAPHAAAGVLADEDEDAADAVGELARRLGVEVAA